MADFNDKPFGIRDCKLKVGASAQVDVPGITKFGLDLEVQNAQLYGDDSLLAVASRLTSVKVNFEFSGIPIDAIATIFGLTIPVATGTTPNQIVTLSGANVIALPYTKIGGQMVGEGVEGKNIIFYKAKLTSLSIAGGYADFPKITAAYNAVADTGAANKVFEIIALQTIAPLTLP